MNMKENGRGTAKDREECVWMMKSMVRFSGHYASENTASTQGVVFFGML